MTTIHNVFVVCVVMQESKHAHKENMVRGKAEVDDLGQMFQHTSGLL